MNEIKILGKRQTGKTTILIDLAKANLKRKKRILFVTTNSNSARKVKQLFGKDYKNLTIAPATNSICGMTADIVLIDDCDFIDKKIIAQVIEPAIAATKGIIYSTWLK